MLGGGPMQVNLSHQIRAGVERGLVHGVTVDRFAEAERDVRVMLEHGAWSAFVLCEHKKRTLHVAVSTGMA